MLFKSLLRDRRCLVWFLKQYAGLIVGVIIGATVATLTTMVAYGDLPSNDPEALKQCLLEYSLKSLGPDS
jgi:uncharacterized membrane-anchored protein YhcB (DUF1043 family)